MVSDRPAPVGLVFVDDKAPVLIPVDAESFWFAVILADEKAHLIERQIVTRAEGFQLLNGFGHADAAALHAVVGRAAEGADRLGILDILAAIFAADFHRRLLSQIPNLFILPQRR
ncbi:MAG: hypothetical protein IJ705_00045 [Oscillospiraceae bacterium]|nr:hypothetical protein [Oscillospiraceae bacterium]